MSEDVHERAKRLAAAARVEGIPVSERAWLDSHLEVCPACARHAASLERTIGAVRSLSAPLDPALVEATRRRVLFRAQELREQESRMRALWMACALSWAVGVLTAPLVWWGLEWVGERLALPQPAWVAAFLFIWTAPAAAVAAFLTWRRSHMAGENGYGGIDMPEAH